MHTDPILLDLGRIAMLAKLFGPNDNHRTSTQRGTNGAVYDDDAEPDETELRDKLAAVFLSRPWLRARWEGGTDGLADTSRSGFDMSLGGMLKAAEFSKAEMIAALRLNETTGFGPERGSSIPNRRYYDRIWDRSRAAPLSDLDFGPDPTGPSNPSPAEDEDDPWGTAAQQAQWPEPVDCFTPLSADPIDVTEDVMPPALWPFINDTAERMGAARSTVALNSIVTCAAVIPDDWCIQPKRHDFTWTENARLWGAVVGPPAILKTPILVACTRPVDRMEAEARRQWQADMERYKTLHAAWKARDGDPADEPKSPRKARWLVESCTIEALQEVLRDDGEARFAAPSGKVLVRQDELSEFLANLDRYAGNGRQGGDRGAYLRLDNGGPFSVDRIGRGAFSTPNWSGCILGGVQPEPIQRIAKDAVDHGLLQRFLYDVPPPTGEGVDRAPDRNAIERYQRLIAALAALRPGQGGVVVAFHEDAHQHRAHINAAIRDMASLPGISAQLRSALGKLPGRFARLCLTFHLIEVADVRAQGNGHLGPSPFAVPAGTAERVARYLRTVLMRHLLRADAVMFATAQSGHACWIAGYILAHRLDRIAVRDVMRAYRPMSAPETRLQLTSVMASLVNLGWLDPMPPSNPLRPVSAWRVNPQVHVMFAARAERERQERQQRQEDIIRRKQAYGTR